jgi:hypothetical protein
LHKNNGKRRLEGMIIVDWYIIVCRQAAKPARAKLTEASRYLRETCGEYKAEGAQKPVH